MVRAAERASVPIGAWGVSEDGPRGSMVRLSVVKRWVGPEGPTLRTLRAWIVNGTLRGRRARCGPMGVLRYYVHRDDAIALRDGTPLASERRDEAKT